ncbi:MAG: L-threonylcarbamoyladenylate synthase [Rickettsiaceae bacterium]
MSDITEAVEIIKNGGLVAFPTETVYGLGADATNQQACLSIFTIKERPLNNPLIVHVGSIKDAYDIVEFNQDAKKLTKLWPGPITLVLPKAKGAMLADCVTAGLESVAIRIPAQPIALKLLNAFGKPIVAPSANKSGTLSSTTAAHVRKNFGDDLFTINSVGKSTYGLESTILDLTTSVPTILRLGFFTPEVLERILGKTVAVASKTSVVKAPGMLLKHYAPKTNLRLNATSLMTNEVGLNFGDSLLTATGSINLSVRANLLEAAAKLYECLHILDDYCLKHGISTIAVANIPQEGVGLAINDRLMKAAAD